MDHEELQKELATNLYFQLKDDPLQITEQINKTEKKVPLNLKLRVRKNNKLHLKKNIVTESVQYQDNCHLASSDDTITSFKLFLETNKDKENSKKHRNKISKMLRPGLCLNIQNKKDKIPYMPNNSSGKRNEINELKTLSNYDAGHRYFGLSKNNFIKNSLTDFKKPKMFIGKCKPGGCLDPAFSEDNYEYYISKKNHIPEKINDPYAENLDFNHGNDIKIANTPNNFEIASWNFKDKFEINTIQHIYEAESLTKINSSSHSSTLVIYPTSLSNDEINNTKNMNKTATESSPEKLHLGMPNGTYFTPPRNVKKRSDSKISMRNNSDEVNIMKEKLKSIEGDVKQGLRNKIRSSASILENRSNKADTKRNFISSECELEMPDVNLTFLREKVHQNNEYGLIPQIGSMIKDSIVVKAKSISECGDNVKNASISHISTNIVTNENIEKPLILSSQETKVETDDEVNKEYTANFFLNNSLVAPLIETQFDTDVLNRAADELVISYKTSQTNNVTPPNTVSIENTNTKNTSFLQAEEIPALITAIENIGIATSDKDKTEEAKIVSEISIRKSLQNVVQESLQIDLNNFQNNTTPSQDRVPPETNKLTDPYVTQNNAEKSRAKYSKSSPVFSLSNRSLNHKSFQKNFNLQTRHIKNVSLDKEIRSVDNMVGNENNSNLIQQDNENELSTKPRDDIKTIDNFSHSTDLDQDDYDILPSTSISSSHDSKYETDTTHTFTNKVQYSSNQNKKLVYKNESALNSSIPREHVINQYSQMQSEKQKENESVPKIFQKEVEQLNVPKAKMFDNNIIVTDDINSLNIGSVDEHNSKLDGVKSTNNETSQIESKIDLSPIQSRANASKDVDDFNSNKELRNNLRTENHENTKADLKHLIPEINLDSEWNDSEQLLTETSQRKHKDRHKIEPDVLNKITIPKSNISVENERNIAEEQLRTEKNYPHSRHKMDEPHVRKELFDTTNQVNENTKSNIDDSISFLKIPAPLALKNDIYLIDFKFAIFMNEYNEKTIKSLDTSQTYDENTNQNQASVMIKSQMRTSNKEIRFPVDSENDLIIQIKKNRVINQKVYTSNSFPFGENVLEGTEESKNQTKTYNDEANKLQNILSWIYNHELVPLQNVIKELRDDIDFLTEQQQHNVTIQQVKKTKSMKLVKFTKDCTCLL